MPRAGGGVLVLANGADDAAPGAAYQEEHERGGERDQDPADDHDPELVGGVAEGADPVATLHDRVEGVEAARDRLQAEGPARDLGGGGGADQQAQDLGGGERGDGEVFLAQAQGGETEHEGEDDAEPQPEGDAEPERAAPGRDGDGGAVGGHHHEGDLAEVEQAGVAEMEVEADHEQREDRGLRAEAGAAGVP